MERLTFAKSWREFFGGAGLKSFADLYDYPGGTRIGENRRRDVYRLTFGEGPDAKTFYRKRFKNPHLKDILSARCNFGKFVSQAQVEWDNANLLLENGIDTYKPVCMGERTICGLEKNSFIITEQLNSTYMPDFVVAKWQSLERNLQDRIVIAMAQLARKAHQANICVRTLYIWHLFIDEDNLDDDCRLSLIDLHLMLRNVKNPNKKVRDTAALYWSMSGDYFDDEHKDLLVATYLGNERAGDKKHILAGIRRRADVLDKRKKLRQPYEMARKSLIQD